MVRSTTRRTRTDVEALAAIVSGDAAADTHDRRDRLVAHGWLQTSGDGAYATTDTGRKVGAIASGLIDRDDFEATVDLMGLPAFVDACGAVDVVDAEAYFAGIRTVDATVEAALDDAGLWHHYDAGNVSYTFGDARLGRVEVAFDQRCEASAYELHAPDRFDVTRKHDERFKRGRNPRRLIVDVDA